MVDYKGIEDVAAVLDDIATKLDEVKDNCVQLKPDVYEQMKLAIEKATSAIDRLADRDSKPNAG